MSAKTTSPAGVSNSSDKPEHTHAEQSMRQHPDVGKLMARDAVCADFLGRPSMQIWVPPARTVDNSGPKAERVGAEDLFSRTLNTPETIDRFVFCWDESQPQPTPQSRAAAVGEENEKDESNQKPDALDVMHAFISVGKGVSGWQGVVHGGIVATIFDEAMGYVPTINRMRGTPMFGNAGYMTGYLNTRYHRPVGTPGVLLVTSRVVKLEGRKCWIKSEMRNTAHGGLEGPVLASCEALFIALTTRKPVL
ncbi:acyl-coenzyme A thioesterase THEM4 [Microdochium nivale]|nr:acyl-coenzyme A thioesterase THEM4 [Microdochium nivale]